MPSLHHSIYEVLAQVGVERTRGKMVCPKCDKRKLTANDSKGIAKCWGCNAFWTVNGTETAPEQDWATYIVATVAAACQDALSGCRPALDWLEHRNLPINDTDWLMDNDLGCLPGDLDVHSIAFKANQLWTVERENRMAEVLAVRKVSETLRGKEGRAHAIKADRLSQAIIEADGALDHIAKNILPILNSDDWLDAIVYIYRDADGNPCSLNIRQYEVEPDERKVMRVQPRANKRGVFGVIDAQYDAGEGWKGQMPALTVVEGEHNLLSLRACTDGWGLLWYIPGVAIGGKNGADVASIKALSRDTDPFIIYDNDRVNPSTGMPVGYELVDAISNEMYCSAATTPDGIKDLDDYIKGLPALKPTKLFVDVFHQSNRVPMKISTIADRVATVLNKKEIENNARELQVTGIIVADLKLRAKLYNADGNAALLLPDGHDRTSLIPAQARDPKFAALLRGFGIVRPEWLDAVARAIEIETSHCSIPRQTVHSLAHWTGKNLYVNCYDGSMIKMTVHAKQVNIDRVPAGTDDVLMLRSAASLEDETSKQRPWLNEDVDLDEIKLGSIRVTEGSPLDVGILSSIVYASDAAHHKQMIKAWLLALFFSSTMKSRPILMFEGVRGGGKSAVGFNIGTLLIGPKFAVTTAPTTGKEVGEKMSGVPLVVFDEWDTPSKPVENALKLLTTGGIDSRRELYTTSKVVELSCDAAVITTTNSNPIKQAGGSRRVLVVPVASRSTEANEEAYLAMGDHLLPKLMTQRSAMWLELLGDLANCVLAMHSTPSETSTALSMADFGVFFQRCADFEDWGREARIIVSKINAKQDDQAAQARVVLDLMTDFLRISPLLQGKHLTAKEWTGHLQATIPDYDAELKRKVNKSYFAWETKTFSDLFIARLGMVENTNKHSKTKTYAFRMTGDKVMDIAEAA